MVKIPKVGEHEVCPNEKAAEKKCFLGVQLWHIWGHISWYRLSSPDSWLNWFASPFEDEVTPKEMQWSESALLQWPVCEKKTKRQSTVCFGSSCSCIIPCQHQPIVKNRVDCRPLGWSANTSRRGSTCWQVWKTSTEEKQTSSAIRSSPLGS